MDSKQIFAEIKEDISSVLEKGQDVIGVEVLLSYLKDKESQLDLTPEEAERQHSIQLERFKQSHELQIVQSKSAHDANLEMFRSVLNTGTTAIKTALVVNGAAAVAILGFLSRAWASSIPSDVAKGLALSLLFFGVGVLLSALATVSAYGTQHCFQHKNMVAGYIVRMFAIIFVLVSYVLFGMGVWNAFQFFQSNL
jgi:hypothetical protein